MKFFPVLVFFSLLIINKMNAQLTEVSYNAKSQKLTGVAVKPSKARTDKAGILILPAWKGIQVHEKEVAHQLSDWGYHTFIADIYGEGKYPKDSKEAGAMAGYYKKNVGEYQVRIHLALDQLIKSGASKDKIVIIGYCFGGTGALEAARVNMPVAGVVSFHGGLGRDTARTIQTINPRVLVCHGADDFYVPKQEIDNFQNEMRTAKADWQMNYYANAVHAFTEKSAGNDNSKGAAYNEKADKRSWSDFMTFLESIFEK